MDGSRKSPWTLEVFHMKQMGSVEGCPPIATADMEGRSVADIMAALKLPLTATVPAAGHLFFGYNRSAAYDAAARGDLPTIRVGQRLRVSVPALLQRLLDAGKEKAA
jgi:hypothetical protein